MIRDGSLGDVLEATVTVLNGGGLDPAGPLHWRHRADYSGHNIMMLGIFNEIVQRWLGDTITVLAGGRIAVDRRPDPETGQPRLVDVPDSFGVFATLAGGARVTYTLSALAAGAPAPAISIYGSRATLHWTMDDRACWATHGGDWKDLEPDPGTARGWQVEADFVTSIRTGAPVILTSFDDGLKYMLFTDACWQSWQQGRAVDIAGVAR
jgi:predicted dehydrogenase